MKKRIYLDLVVTVCCVYTIGRLSGHWWPITMMVTFIFGAWNYYDGLTSK